MTQPQAPWSIDDLVSGQRWLLHNDTGVVGRAKQLHPKGTYVSPLGDGKPLSEAALELDTNDVFVIRPDAFTPLSEREVGLVEGVSTMVSSAITIAIRQAAAAKINLPVASLLILSVLKMHERSLDLEARKALALQGTEHG